MSSIYRYFGDVETWRFASTSPRRRYAGVPSQINSILDFDLQQMKYQFKLTLFDN